MADPHIMFDHAYGNKVPHIIFTKILFPLADLQTEKHFSELISTLGEKKENCVCSSRKGRHKNLDG
jgi:hypothetical protein